MQSITNHEPKFARRLLENFDYDKLFARVRVEVVEHAVRLLFSPSLALYVQVFYVLERPLQLEFMVTQ